MKRVLVVVALLGAMLLVGWLKQSGGQGAASLAGMGFVMLAAYAVAELGSALSLPLVTGYIVAGVVLGPSVGGIISGQMIDDMRMFNTLALGLIATSAGLELDVRQIARLAKTLVLTTLIKVVLGVSLVALSVWVVERALGLLGLETSGELMTLALVLGVLSIGTSPSISLAVLSETRAKGRLSDLVLGAAVFKDLVLVVGLAIATTVGRVWLSPGAALDASVLIKVGIELGGSILAGSVVGLIFILYVRFIRAEMLLFVAAMILVVAELCRAFHLELLLVFIASGFVVRNFSEYEHEMMPPLRLVALPVFVLFFANAGASVDLLTTWTILPLALAACAARTLTYILASNLGGKWAGESPSIRRYAWLAYLPQAGVTLGLVGLAGLQLPELAGPIANTGMAIVAVNLLIGPITLRRALGLLGEIPKAGAEGEPSEGGAATRSRLAVRALTEPPQSSPHLLPEPLQRAHAALADEISRALARFDAEVKPALPPLPPLADTVPELEAFREVVLTHRAQYRQLYAELMGILAAVPRVVGREAQGGQTGPRWPWRVQRGQVPLRRIARIALGPALARLVARRFEAGLGARTAETDRPVGVASQLSIELDEGLTRLALLMQDAGTRRLPERRLRYSEVEPQVRRALQSLLADSDADLARLARGAWGTALLEQQRVHVTSAMNDVVRRCLTEPGLSTTAKVRPAVHEMGVWLDNRQLDFQSRASTSADLARVRSELDALSRATLTDLSREFRFAATVRTTLSELVASVSSVPDSIECLALDKQGSISLGKVQSVPLRARVDALVRHVMPPIDHAARSVATALNQLLRRVDDAVQMEWSLLEAQVDSSTQRELPALVRERLGRVHQRIDEVALATLRTVDAALMELDVALDAAYAAFAEDLLPGPVLQGQREARLQAFLGRLRSARAKLAELLRTAVAGPSPLDDAAAIRHALYGAERTALPEAVERWFNSAPVSDERIFAGHRRLLDDILDAEGSRAAVGRASVLVVGSKGSGKSSLLNMCELELPYAMHLRLHASDFGRDVTLFEGMGTLLDCPPTPAGLTRHLRLRGPAVFVDDLPSWISAAQNRQLELERVLSLVAQTSQQAFWVVSIDLSMLQLLGEMARLEEVFSHVLQLSPLSFAEVKHLVESRIELLNLDVEFRTTRWAHVVDKLRSASESDRIYQRLWRATRGNPGRVVALCREAFSLDGQQLTLSADAVRAPAVPRFDFTTAQLATLATLHRYGPQPLERLARELAIAPPPLWRSVTFLMSAGLVRTVDDGHAFAICPAAEWMVFKTLSRAKLALE